MTENHFQNENIAESTIPTAAQLAFEPLEARYQTVLIIPWVLTCCLVVLAGSVIYYLAEKSLLIADYPFFGIPAFLLTVSGFIWAPLMTKACGLALRDKDIHFKSGVIWQKRVSLPFNRIQHVEVESGPLDRLFKLATLKIFTAGGGSTDMCIPGLGFERASKLRSFIMKKAGISLEGDGAQADA